jgi:hypothetical protein
MAPINSVLEPQARDVTAAAPQQGSARETRMIVAYITRLLGIRGGPPASPEVLALSA